MDKDELESLVLECPSPTHKNIKPKLNGFKYIDGNKSPYYHCSECRNLYELKGESLVNLYEENLSNVPLLLNEDGMEIDPYDLIGDDDF